MTPHPNSWTSVLILFSHLCLGQSSCFLSFRSPNQILYTPLLSPTRCTCPTHLILDLINRIIFGDQYILWSCSLFSPFQSTVISSLLVPNIFLCTLFSHTLSQCSFLNVRNQVSHPFKTKGKIIFLHILTFVFLESKLDRMVAGFPRNPVCS
jgi:hypothetical protein